jgi:hypothetical protein
LLLLCAAVRWPQLFHRQHEVWCNFPQYKMLGKKKCQMAGLSFVYSYTNLQRNKSSLCGNVFAGSVGLSACPYSEWMKSGCTSWSMVLFGKVVVTQFMNKHPAVH